MNWDHLQFSIALVNKRTLVKAGRALNANHTIVYRRIKVFEEDLGVLLLKSTSHGYGLTKVGERLYRQVEGIESSIQNITQEL